MNQTENDKRRDEDLFADVKKGIHAHPPHPYTFIIFFSTPSLRPFLERDEEAYDAQTGMRHQRMQWRETPSFVNVKSFQDKEQEEWWKNIYDDTRFGKCILVQAYFSFYHKNKK